MSKTPGPVVKASPWTDPGAQPYVRIEKLTKAFGDFKAVDEVSLNIYKGEIFCLLGASGCGKTTLLRMLGGFETPTSGRIFIDGEDMTGVPPYERPVNMMFQSYALFPHMTVEQNVAFGLKQDGIPKAEIRERVATMLDLVKLGEFGGRKPHQLSGGQRQRVALARSLVKRPKLLLLDEPLGALDKKLREHTQFELIGLQDRLGVTFVVVTHDQEEAMNLSDRIAIMDAGQVVQAGAPKDVYEHPVSAFVARFLGESNLLPGEAAGQGLRRPDGTGLAAANQAQGPALLFVRPEKLVLHTAPPATGNVLTGRVVRSAFLGNLIRTELDVGGGQILVIDATNGAGATRFAPGDTAAASWDAADSRLLPAA